MVVLGMAFVDNWAVGKEKVGYWLSNDIVGLVGNLVVSSFSSSLLAPIFFFLHLSKQDDQICLFLDPLRSFRRRRPNPQSLKVCNPPFSIVEYW